MEHNLELPRDKRTKSDSKASRLRGQGLRGCQYPGAGCKAKLEGSVQNGLVLGLRASRPKRGFPVTSLQQITVTSPPPTSPNLHLPFCILVPHKTAGRPCTPLLRAAWGGLAGAVPLVPVPTPAPARTPGPGEPRSIHTTLLLAVSSKDWITLSLCLNRICSMSSALRLLNFYQSVVIQ